MLIGVLGKHITAQRRSCLPVITKVTVIKCFSSNLPLPTCLPLVGKEDAKRVEELEIKVREARQTPSRSWYEKDRPRVELLNSNGDLFCYKCETFLIPSAFYVDLNRKYGRWSQCKACFLDVSYRYQALTMRGSLNHVLHSAKKGARRRSTKPGRHEAGCFELDLDILLNLWLNQQGRCAYSGLVMSAELYTSWRFSLERCDNSLGYIPSNVVFVCSEFNTADHSAHAKYSVFGSSQWCREKVQLLPDVISASKPMSDGELHTLASRTGLVRKQTISKRKVAPNGDMICTKCNQYKSPSEFGVQIKGLLGRNSVCLECCAQYRCTFRGFFRSKLCDAKSAAKQKAEKGRQEAGVCDLSLSDITTMHELQRGLCFYSSVKLTLRPLSEWMCSLERLDNTKGYTVDNVVLICAEFQTTDHSFSAKVPVRGSAQWSKEKVTMLVQWLHACQKTVS
eukprot:GEMP01041079.1.p1 GENE.GEMP01041079.1~~GEMP01041079.1.p1  ORF type:complete len:452 (+),score=16.56 GEMP01041079.1:505-1860(+)